MNNDMPHAFEGSKLNTFNEDACIHVGQKIDYNYRCEAGTNTNNNGNSFDLYI